MTVTEIAHPSIEDRKASGIAARDRVPLAGHSQWRPAQDRRDPTRPWWRR